MAGNWREKIRKIDPYIPGEQSKDADIVKLNANENPYPPSPKVQEVLQNFLSTHCGAIPMRTAEICGGRWQNTSQ